MADIHIWADTRGKGICRSCGAKIEWAQNARTGRKIPFNGEIVPVKSYHSEDARVVEVIDPSVTTSHFATCPQANDWRRK